VFADPCGEDPPTAAVVTVGAPGVAGIVVTVTDEDAVEYEESPLAFVALTWKVYPVADSSPATEIGEDAPVAVCPPLDNAV
jgi:hypothetical protein